MVASTCGLQQPAAGGLLVDPRPSDGWCRGPQRACTGVCLALDLGLAGNLHQGAAVTATTQRMYFASVRLRLGDCASLSRMLTVARVVLMLMIDACLLC